MIRYLLLHLYPAILAIVLVLFLSTITGINSFLFNTHVNTEIPDEYYIENFQSNSIKYQNLFLESGTYTDNIYLLGSSELTSKYKALPHHFINGLFQTKIYSVGHAGNQCFSIFSQLLANEEKLNNAAIVIIISPFWFQGKYAQGTSPDVFLEFNSEKFLNKIVQNDSIQIFREYFSKRILEYSKTYQSPPFSFKVFEKEKIASEGMLTGLFYTPVVFVYKQLLQLKQLITHHELMFWKGRSLERKEILKESVIVNWDSLFTDSKNDFLKKVTNNNYYVENEYYATHVNGKTFTLQPIDEKQNQEMHDFKMLMQLCHVKKVKASFIIFPMNPYCYTNLHVLNSVVDTIESTITKYNYPCLNMWISDTASFEKGILSDIMHPSEYGWYKANKFIVDTYHLSNNNER